MSDVPNPSTDPVLARGLSMPRVSRRGFLAGAGALGAAAALSACGVKSQAKKTNTATAAVDAYWAKQKKTPGFVFANWPLYIDVSSSNKSDHPSLDLFTKQTGIKVTYKEVIQDDPTFFGQVQPVLAAGQPTGYDLMVITDGIYYNKFVELGYVQPLDHKLVPNFFKNAAPVYQHRSYDPNNLYGLPWQSGFTGIGVNTKYVKRKITSMQDLLDPAFKGKIGMFRDNQDLPNAALLAVGVIPAKSTPTDWKKAAAWLMKQKNAGLVRKYYQQSYIDALSKGDIWISQAWSGDIFQANVSNGNNELEFVIPTEGVVLWTDNMMIPKGAQNALDAITWMNFYYQPDVAAMVANYVNYITPVPAAQQVILSEAAATTNAADKQSYLQVAQSPLVFPTAADYAKAHSYRVLTQSELTEWNSIFEPVYQG